MVDSKDIFDDVDGLVLEEAAKMYSPVVIEN